MAEKPTQDQGDTCQILKVYAKMSEDQVRVLGESAVFKESLETVCGLVAHCACKEV